MTNQMPVDGSIHQGIFLQDLLNFVFRDVCDTAGNGFRDLFRIVQFGDRDERDLISAPAGACR